MFARTKAQREHQRKQWKEVLELMEGMIEVSPEEKRHMAATSIPSRPNRQSFSYEDVKNFVENPIQTSLPSMVRTMTPMLCKLDLAIITTESKIGFITSDAPCAWYDPEAYKRPPFYRAPGLMYETIEITLPISPKSLLLLNRRGVNGYRVSNDKLEDTENRLARFHAEEYFVVNSNFKKETWFDPGIEPEDSWEKSQKAKEKKDT